MNKRVIACDFETASLAARYDGSVPVWCVGFAEQLEDGVQAQVLPWHVGGKTKLEEYVANEDVLLVFHNASFDVAVARSHGVYIHAGKYVCSLLASYLTDTGGEHSLEACGERLGYHKLDFRQALVDANLIHKNTKKGEEFTALDYSNFASPQAKVMYSYCMQDVKVTLRLWQYLESIYANEPRLAKCYQELELPYVEFVLELESTGAYIDKPRLNELGHDLDEQIAKLHRELSLLVPRVPELKFDTDSKQFVGVTTEYQRGYSKHKNNVAKYYVHDGVVCSSEPNIVYEHCKYQDFNPNSADHLAHVLMGMGWKPTAYSKATGKPVLDKEVTTSLADKYEIVNTYVALNKYVKLKNTFVDGLLDNAGSGAVVRGSYNQCVTKTTRLSSSSPNLQNLPARDELGKTIRNCFTAPVGWKVLVGDLDRIEIVVLAYYLQKCVGENRMADAVRSGLDVHQANANAWNVTRTMAKTGIFSVNYGSQAPTLAKQLKATEEVAQALLDAINTGMPLLQSLKELVWKKCRRDGFITDLFGHKLSYPDINSTQKYDRLAAEREVFNALIQAGAGAIFKELCLQAQPAIHSYGGCVAMVVHDELVLYAPEENAQQLADELTKVFCNNTILSGKGYDGNEFHVPITAKFEVGNNWNEAKG